MAAPALSADLQQEIAAKCRAGASKSFTARALGVTWATVSKYWPGDAPAVADVPREGSGPASRAVPPELPRGNHEGPELPEAAPPLPGAEFVNVPGWWLVLTDTHLPYHDRATIELAVGEACRRGAVGVLLNGDTLDSHEISEHDKDPRAPRYVEEIEKGRQFLTWLRDRMPRAEVLYKEGNHEERLGRYIQKQAPALSGLDGVDLPSFLRFEKFGVRWVGDRRKVWLGKLPVIHGHEYKGGGGGVAPALWLWRKARYVSMCGHFHRTSFHSSRNIRDDIEAAWCLGCACDLRPRYMPENDWNHGFGLVHVENDGAFVVESKRVREGKLE